MKECFKGIGCGRVGRAVASYTRNPRFESSHRQSSPPITALVGSVQWHNILSSQTKALATNSHCINRRVSICSPNWDRKFKIWNLKLCLGGGSCELKPASKATLGGTRQKSSKIRKYVRRYYFSFLWFQVKQQICLLSYIRRVDKFYSKDVLQNLYCVYVVSKCY